jgi:hypothetical protein
MSKVVNERERVQALAKKAEDAEAAAQAQETERRLRKLVQQARETRRAQKLYFVCRSQDALIQAKNAEQALDKTLATLAAEIYAEADL